MNQTADFEVEISKMLSLLNKTYEDYEGSNQQTIYKLAYLLKDSFRNDLNFAGHGRDYFFPHPGKKKLDSIEGVIDRCAFFVHEDDYNSSICTTLLEQRGYVVLEYITEHLHPAVLFQEIKKLGKKTSANTDLWFIYQGHGYSFDPNSMKPDFDSSKSRNVLTTKDGKNITNAHELKRAFDVIQKGRLVLIIQACYNRDFHQVFNGANELVITCAMQGDETPHHGYYFVSDICNALQRKQGCVDFSRFSYGRKGAWDYLKEVVGLGRPKISGEFSFNG